MRWENQINLLIKKLRKMIYTLRNPNKGLEKTEMCIIYITLVESLFFYSIIGRGGAFKNTMSQLHL